MIDDTEEHGISNPFTTKLSPELQALKEQQAHSLAPRSGQSRILRKARQKMAEEALKKVKCGVPWTVPRCYGKGRALKRGLVGKTEGTRSGWGHLLALYMVGCGILGVWGASGAHLAA